MFPQVHLLPVKRTGNMPTQAPRFHVLSAQELTLDHGGAADACSQCDHDDVGDPARRTCIALAEKRHARVIFNAKRETKRILAPFWEMYAQRVVVFLVGRKNAPRARIDQPGRAEGETLTILRRDSSLRPQSAECF